MAANDIPNYRSRAARALVLLHEREMRELLETWRKAVKAGVKLPESKNTSYASLQTLLFHGLRAARNYMVWVCEKLALPDPAIDEPPPAERVEAEAARYLDHLFSRWRLPLADVDEARFKESHQTRWGTSLPIDGMLEHAVMHPLRHRFQLEELMESQRGAGR